MGFRNLSHFNKALLAKQVWRLLDNPDSLVAQVFKARYYKHSNIIDATISNNPSFVWRSLMWSREELDFRTLWKVGNGRRIHSRNDAWIPSLAAEKITSNVSYDSNCQVEELLNIHQCWDIGKLNNLFLPYEVDAIIHVPIQGENIEDARYWKFEKKGSYSIRTGYWALNNSSETLSLGTLKSECSEKSSLWSKIWALNIPPRVKVFVWKFAHDIVAAEANLIKHHVPGSSMCVLCSFHWSNSTHSIFFLPGSERSLEEH